MASKKNLPVQIVASMVVPGGSFLFLGLPARFQLMRVHFDVCDCSQDDGRKTVSEQGVQRITSKETAQT